MTRTDPAFPPTPATAGGLISDYLEVSKVIAECDAWVRVKERILIGKSVASNLRLAAEGIRILDHLKPSRLRDRRAIKRLSADEIHQLGDSPYVPVLVAEYPLEALASLIEERGPTIDYEALRDFHDLRVTTVTKANVAPLVIATPFVVAGAILSQVPAGVATWIAGSVETFEEVFFWASLGIGGFLAFYFISAWADFLRSSARLGRIGEVLGFLLIRQEAGQRIKTATTRAASEPTSGG